MATAPLPADAFVVRSCRFPTDNHALDHDLAAGHLAPGRESDGPSTSGSGCAGADTANGSPDRVPCARPSSACATGQWNHQPAIVLPVES
jgi:hypothetical protein